MIITDFDLIKTKFDISILEMNMKRLNKKIVLYTQTLTPKFCIEHILDLDIDNGSEDSYLFDKIHILRNQPHISEEDFNQAFLKYYVAE